jgi:hypothetical protein
MRIFTANAQRAVSQRAIVAAIAMQARNAVTELFARATPFKHAPPREKVSAVSAQVKKTTYKQPAVPTHRHPVRGSLFTQPRRVSAMPALGRQARANTGIVHG